MIIMKNKSPRRGVNDRTGTRNKNPDWDDIPEYCSILQSRPARRSIHPIPNNLQCRCLDGTRYADKDARNSIDLGTSSYCKDQNEDGVSDGTYCKAPHSLLSDSASG